MFHPWVPYRVFIILYEEAPPLLFDPYKKGARELSPR